MKNKWDIEAWFKQNHNTETFMDTLYELNGGNYESIPEDIQEGWDNLSKKEQIEIVYFVSWHLME